MLPRISRSEGWWLLLVTLGILLLTLVPPTVERLWGPQDRVHVGTYWYPQDFGVYYATMREAASSDSWLVHNHFSAEPHEPALLLVLYVAIGKAAAATGLPLLALFAAAEIAARILLPTSLYLFVATFLRDPLARRRAFLLAAFSSGLWGLIALGDVALNPSPAAEPRMINNFVEVMTFGALLAAPHVPLGLAATLMAVVLFGASLGGRRAALFLLVADIWALALLHPYTLSVLLSVFAVYSALGCFSEGRLSWWPILATTVPVAAAAPWILYYTATFSATFTSSSFWAEAYRAPTSPPSPPPGEIPADYGVVLVLVVLGVLQLWRNRDPSQNLLLIWIAAASLWMYSPVPQQRRFAFGLQPALAAAAAMGWPLARQGAARLVSLLPLPPALWPGAAERLVNYGVYSVVFSGSLLVYLVVVYGAATGAEMMYPVDRDTYALGEWLAAHTGPEDVIAGSLNTSDALGGLIPGRVVVAHPTVTIRAQEKKATMEAIFRGELSPEQIGAFFHANRVSYVVVGPEERKLGPHDPGARWGWPVAMQVGTAIAYRVGEPPSEAVKKTP